ncbi:universal stress protein [Nocardia sp. alder85J]|uniref:universal stress protein n=1 Tax=Nocardia sp. alder85J TaxID=2862949 RepID=UPI001CD8085E|nr:universal stress protein [Nocardia sp. alder85J]MCX4092420.1 universal stress protein [Nocardia sp. alder85J]
MTEHNAPPTPDPSAPIIAAVDGSAVSYSAAAWAAADAALYGCRLHLITSVAVPPGFGAAMMTELDWLRVEGERILTEAERIARTAVPGDELSITKEVTTRHIVGELVERSRTVRMVVVGSRGLGALGRGLLGSVGSAVIRHAHCPAVVVHSISATDPILLGRPVVVGVDGSANSIPALRLAFEEASHRKVGLVAVHAWSDMSAALDISISGWDAIRDTEDAVFAESMAGWTESYPDVPVRRILARDHPTRAILDVSEEAQLVVVGSHGRGGFTGMLIGSTSSALAHVVECPIVVVRGPGA